MSPVSKRGDRAEASEQPLVRGRELVLWSGSSRLFGPLDFELHAGHWLVLRGANGSGKSTLLRHVAGLPASATTGGNLPGGSTRSGQRALTRNESDSFGFSGALEVSAARVGMVFQEPRLLGWLSVRDNLILVLRATGMRAAASRQRSDEILDALGLSQHAAALPAELSGGMQQRVAIARAVSVRPSLLLLDEPFSAQDSSALTWLAPWLGRAAEQAGSAVILASHIEIPKAWPSHAVALELTPVHRDRS